MRLLVVDVSSAEVRAELRQDFRRERFAACIHVRLDSVVPSAYDAIAFVEPTRRNDLVVPLLLHDDGVFPSAVAERLLGTLRPLAPSVA